MIRDYYERPEPIGLDHDEGSDAYDMPVAFQSLYWGTEPHRLPLPGTLSHLGCIHGISLREDCRLCDAIFGPGGSESCDPLTPPGYMQERDVYALTARQSRGMIRSLLIAALRALLNRLES